MLDKIRQLTGIYGTGFDRESVLGLMLPVAIVVLIGGLGAILILVR